MATGDLIPAMALMTSARRLAACWLLCAVALSGCGKDSGSDGDDQEGQEPVALGLSGTVVFDVPPMEFEQGELSTYAVEAKVPPPHQWSITAENLPEGAIFENNALSWRPSCALSLEDGDFLRGYLLQYVRFTLNFKDNEALQFQDTTVLIVHRFNKAGKTCGSEEEGEGADAGTGGAGQPE